MIDFSEHFNDSYERVTRDSDKFYDEFYKIFFSSSEEIPILFKNVKMPEQKLMLKESLIFVISFFVSKKADNYLCDIAILHHDKLKIQSHYYELWINSMIEAVKKTDGKFDSQTEMAWRITLAPGIEFMKHYSRSLA